VVDSCWWVLEFLLKVTSHSKRLVSGVEAIDYWHCVQVESLYDDKYLLSRSHHISVVIYSTAHCNFSYSSALFRASSAQASL